MDWMKGSIEVFNEDSFDSRESINDCNEGV
jgi:hypothetical protein